MAIFDTPSFVLSDAELADRVRVYDGFFRVDRYRLRHRLFGGGWTDVFARELFERGHSAAALLYDPVRDLVVLLEQFRIGPFAAGEDPWLVEVVGGVLDEEGEDAADVVRREAVEEAGAQVLDLVHVCDYFVSPGGSSEVVSLFIARIDAAKIGGVFGLKEEHEDIRVVAVPFAAALKLLARGRIRNAQTIIPLQHLALHRQALRAHWGAAPTASAAGA